MERGSLQAPYVLTRPGKTWVSVDPITAIHFNEMKSDINSYFKISFSMGRVTQEWWYKYSTGDFAETTREAALKTFNSDVDYLRTVFNIDKSINVL